MSEPTTEELIEKTLGLGSVNPDLLRIITDRLRSQQSHLNNLLSVIHRDGGQYQDRVGTEQAVQDAMAIIPQMWEKVDGLQDRIAELEAKLHAANTVCDNERENDRLLDLVFQIYQVAGIREDGDELQAVKDLRAENEQLREQLETDAATVRCEGCDEQDELEMDSANYRGECGECGTPCMSMLTDDYCAACRIEELEAKLDRLARSHLLKVEAMQSIRVYLQCCRGEDLREAIHEVVDNAEWLEGEPDFTVVTQFGWDKMYESNQQLKAENERLIREREALNAIVREYGHGQGWIDNEVEDRIG